MAPKRLALIYKLLLTKKAFIDKRPNIRGTMRYCIYLDAGMPIMFITKAEYNYIEPVLLTKDKVQIISRNAIRKCHGKSYLKSIYLTLYKQSHEQSTSR